MNLVQMSLFAAAFTLCCLTGLLTWRTPLRKRYVTLFLAVMAFMFACDWLMHHPAMPLKSLWLLGLMMSAFLVSPCALWLATSISGDELAVPWRRHLHLVLLAWLMLTPLASVIHWGPDFANTGAPVSAQYSLIIHSTMLMAVGIFLFQTWLSVKSCCHFLSQRSSQNRVLLSDLDDPGLEALRTLVIAVIVNAVVCLVRVLYCALLDGTYPSLSLSIAGTQALMALGLAVSFIRQAFAAASREENLRADLFAQQNSTASLAKQANIKKYRNSAVTDAQRSAVLQKLHFAMDADQLYLEAGLSLQGLCDYLGESAHTVSQVINESELQNFYDMINRRRTLAATHLLEQEQEKTVLDIAFACGFSSKSSFNGVFKRYTGLTPTQYRSRAREQFSQVKV